MKSIRGQLRKYFFTTVLIALIALAGVSYLLTSNIIADREYMAMTNESIQLAREFDHYIENEFSKLEIISRNNLITNPEVKITDKIEALKQEVQANNYVVMDFITLKGTAYLTSGNVLDVRDRDYFKKALTGKNALSDLIISKDDGTLIFVFATPVYFEEEVVGVVVAVKNVTGMSDYLGIIENFDSAQELVIDGEGKVIVSSNVEDVFNQKTIQEMSSFASVDTFASAVKKNRILKIDGEEKFVSLQKVEKTGWYVLVSISKSEVLALLDSARNGFIILSGIIIILSFIIISSLGDRISTPIRLLAADVEVLKKSMFEGSIDEKLINENSEVGFLAKSIDEMVEVKRKNFLEIRLQKEEIEALYEETAALNEELEYLFDQRNSLSEEIISTQRELLFMLGGVVEAKSQETGDHVERVSIVCYRLAKMVGMREEGAELLRSAAPMHDVGKISIPDAILNKPGKLTTEEYDVIKKHTIYGGEILSKSDRPMIRVAREVALGHHERWDGTGYPNKVSKNDIPLNARIVAIADVFDSLASKRVYKDAWDYDKIKAYFMEQRGKQFDPLLTDILVENFDEFVKLREGIGDNDE